jgi:uncharacterized membrane-anchored protein YitT (DUF2179 family)
MTRALIDVLKQSLLIAGGSLLFALGVKALIVPQGFLSSGLTGFALLIYYQWPVLPLGWIYFIINVPIFALGWKFVGRRFVAYSLWGMVIYSAALSLITLRVPLSDPLLATLVGAALAGTGTAIVLRSYGSSGGGDILCVIMHKLFSFTLGTGSLVTNAALLVVSAFLFPLELVVHTLVFLYVAAQFTDRVFHSMTRRRTAIIISHEWQRIAQALAAERVGFTLLNGKGGFQGEDRTILYSVLTARAVPLLKRVAAGIDKSAFVTIMEAADVTSVEVGNQPHW